MKKIKLIIHEWYYDTFYKSRVRYYGREKGYAALKLQPHVFIRDGDYGEVIVGDEEIGSRIILTN